MYDIGVNRYDSSNRFLLIANYMGIFPTKECDFDKLKEIMFQNGSFLVITEENKEINSKVRVEAKSYLRETQTMKTIFNTLKDQKILKKSFKNILLAEMFLGENYYPVELNKIISVLTSTDEDIFKMLGKANKGICMIPSFSSSAESAQIIGYSVKVKDNLSIEDQTKIMNEIRKTIKSIEDSEKLVEKFDNLVNGLMKKEDFSLIYEKMI